METLHTARVVAMGGRNGRVRSDNGCIRLPLSSFGTLGGEHREGANPEQLFGAAYGSCFGALIQLVAEQQKIELSPDFSVTSIVSLQRDNFKKFHLKVILDCYLPHITEAEAANLIHTAHHICPYSNAMQNNVTVIFNWLSDDE